MSLRRAYHISELDILWALSISDILVSVCVIVDKNQLRVNKIRNHCTGNKIKTGKRN